jgi:hypothetical protein
MAKKDIPALAAFALSAEAHAIAAGITVCRITHPDAIDGAIHEGAASGIHLTKGDAVSALLSDGSTI